MTKYSIFLAVVLLFAGCKDNQKTETEAVDGIITLKETDGSKEHPGKIVMEQECYLCHDPKASLSDRIAPPMEAIKRHYIDSSVTKEDFTKALIRWVNDPETASKMPGAHQNFGPMPYMPLADDAIAQIADYIYDNEIERPGWFEAHFLKAHKNGKCTGECQFTEIKELKARYAETGLGYVREAKTQLGNHLTKAIQESGTVGAIEFCHTKATKLTDSLSMMKNAVISRVSDKPRNPMNLANPEELEYIKSFEKNIARANKIKPIVYVENGEVAFYYPITTNTLCLQCHGKPNDQIRPETLTALKGLYPTDKAVGYKVEEVRGLWSIKFDINN